MSIAIALFFIHNVIATLLLGVKFISRENQVVKDFGMGLILNAVAFAIWTLAVLTHPDNLSWYVTFGALFFILSLIFFLAGGVEGKKNLSRSSIFTVGIILAAVVIFLRIWVYPSQPGFSPDGLFVFNTDPVMQVIYIFALALTVLPATVAVASKFSHKGYARLILYGFIIQVMGGVILITSNNSAVLYIDGWIIGLTYLLLWTSLLTDKRAWASLK